MGSDKSLVYAVYLIAAYVAVLALSAVVDVVQSVRAEPAMYACEAQGLRHRRPTFTTDVICVPMTKEVDRG